jgi:hypothetical protein
VDYVLSMCFLFLFMFVLSLKVWFGYQFVRGVFVAMSRVAPRLVGTLAKL